MDYNEFLEGLAAAACYKSPNPYVGLDQRIEHFLLSRIFPGERKGPVKLLKG